MYPEYASDGLFSIMSDVFSFGVVILEIISGRKNIGFYQSEEALNLLGYVSEETQTYIFFVLFASHLIESNHHRHGDCG